MRSIGIDIGGANTKIASSDMKIAELHYIPLWKNSRLPEVLQDIAKRLGPCRTGVVMTGELADCFSDKAQGVRYIMDAVDSAFPGAYYLNNRGQFIDSCGDIRSLAAANWMASALVIAREQDCIFADMGSTTTDLIPIKKGKVLAGVSDFQRLGRSELIYRGILRTNIAAVIDRIELNGVWYRLASELFAQTGDIHLLLGNITEGEYTCDTPDGMPPADAARRLARVVCADTTELSSEDIMKIAAQVYDRLRSELAEALSILSEEHDLHHLVGCGMGEFMIADAAQQAGLLCSLVSDRYGKAISKVFPAYAVACLVNDI